MINAGKPDIRQLADGWTIVTKDHSLSAQWEHTVLVADRGYEVLTVSAGAPPPFHPPVMSTVAAALAPPPDGNAVGGMETGARARAGGASLRIPGAPRADGARCGV